MGCGRCSGGGNRGLTGQRGPHRAGGIGPVLRAVDRSLGTLWWAAEATEVWSGAPSGSGKWGHHASCCRRALVQGLQQGPLARWSPLPARASLAVAPACERTGLILRCARKVGNPLQTEKGSRPSCRNQERRRGSDEVVPGTSVFPLSESGEPCTRSPFILTWSTKALCIPTMCQVLC